MLPAQFGFNPKFLDLAENYDTSHETALTKYVLVKHQNYSSVREVGIEVKCK